MVFREHRLIFFEPVEGGKGLELSREQHLILELGELRTLDESTLVNTIREIHLSRKELLIALMDEDRHKVRQAAFDRLLQIALDEIDQKKEPLAWKNEIAPLPRHSPHQRVSLLRIRTEIEEAETNLLLEFGSRFRFSKELLAKKASPLPIDTMMAEVTRNSRNRVRMFPIDPERVYTEERIPDDARTFWQFIQGIRAGARGFDFELRNAAGVLNVFQRWPQKKFTASNGALIGILSQDPPSLAHVDLHLEPGLELLAIEGQFIGRTNSGRDVELGEFHGTRDDLKTVTLRLPTLSDPKEKTIDIEVVCDIVASPREIFSVADPKKPDFTETPGCRCSYLSMSKVEGGYEVKADIELPIGAPDPFLVRDGFIEVAECVAYDKDGKLIFSRGPAISRTIPGLYHHSWFFEKSEPHRLEFILSGRKQVLKSRKSLLFRNVPLPTPRGESK